MNHEIPNRNIVHMDLDTFFVSCERLINSHLIGKPLLIGGTSDRGVVAACSYEARAFGIHSAMPMKMAKKLCPDAIVLHGNSATYSKHSQDVTDIIRETVPLYEKSSVDEFYIDLTGIDKFHGCQKMASELRQRIIKETGLPISYGLSSNKTVSKIATSEAKPNNQIQIFKGDEKSFLAPLSVRKIPMVGEKTYRSLCDLGIQQIQTIQEMPIKMMAKVFGENGIRIWKKANGIDLTPVIPYQERKSISTERTFDTDTIDVDKLKTILVAMAENLIFQLRRGNKLSACITVKIRYSDFQTYTLQKRIPYSASDQIILPIVIDLYRKIYQRRLLVRLIGVKLSHLVGGGHQINLFEEAENAYDLYQAMDKIRDKYGDRMIMRASGFGAKSISRWNPFTGEPPPLLANRRS
jgi:DNA polymerase IV